MALCVIFSRDLYRVMLVLNNWVAIVTVPRW